MQSIRRPDADGNSVTGAVSPDRMMADLKVIAAQDRAPGSPGEALIFDYIDQQMRALPATVTRLSMEGFVSVPLSAALTIHITEGDLEIPCITHSGTASTGPAGFRAQVVQVGKGLVEDYRDDRARGAIALVDGRPTATSLERAEAGGCLVQVYREPNPVPFHNLCTFAGNPTDEALVRLPRGVAVSVGEADGKRLSRLLDDGPVTATVTAAVETGWRQLPLLTVDIAPDRGEPTFAFFGTHVDSWCQGAVDNGAGTAALMEIARVIASRRDQLHRGVRLLFWSGHEHGLYAGSSWYVDHHWDELYEGAVAALAIDSPGAANPTHLARSKVMDELAEVAAEAARLAGKWEVPAPRRPVSGEQPLWRIGVPSLHPDKLTPEDRSWMHTAEDQFALIDPDVLALDTRIHVAALWAIVGAERLPLRYATLADRLAGELNALGENFDLSSSVALSRRLSAAAAELESLPPKAANDAVRRLGRALIPTLYTRSGSFDLDPLPLKDPLATAPKGFLVGLQDARRLPDLEPGKPSYQGLQVRLTRQRNRLDFALRSALEVCANALREAPPMTEATGKESS